MDPMFWVWLGVIVATIVIEFATMEIISIWFTVGAVIPFILAATNSVAWWVQILVFIGVSALLIISLRNVTKKFLLKNSEGKTNLESVIGQEFRMIEKTDFETIGAIKINDVVWSAVEENHKAIDKGEIVQVVRVQGNKMIVKKVSSSDKKSTQELSSQENLDNIDKKEEEK